jgi:hypothetical protein
MGADVIRILDHAILFKELREAGVCPEEARGIILEKLDGISKEYKNSPRKNTADTYETMLESVKRRIRLGNAVPYMSPSQREFVSNEIAESLQSVYIRACKRKVDDTN